MRQRSVMPLNRWHRRAGVAASAVLIYLIATGLPLQYSAELDLGARHVHWAPLLDWYGLEAPEQVVASGGLASVGDEVFARDGHLLTLPGFLGASVFGDLVVAAGSHEVVLLTADTLEPVDRWPLTVSATALGSWHDRPILRTHDGLLAADADLANWRTTAAHSEEITWVQRNALDADAAVPFRKLYRQRMLSVERTLQDLHSGRLFGTAGILIIDLASLLLIFLAVSGLMMWMRYSTSRSRR